MNIELKPIDSSLIAAAGYDAATQTLAVEFVLKGVGTKVIGRPGPTYHYANVTPELFAAFLAAESHGRWFQKVIKAQPKAFPFTKQEVAAAKCSACGDIAVPSTDLCSRCLHEWEYGKRQDVAAPDTKARDAFGGSTFPDDA